MDLAGAIQALTDIGVFPVISVVAIVGLATLVYKRFRK